MFRCQITPPHGASQDSWTTKQFSNQCCAKYKMWCAYLENRNSTDCNTTHWWKIARSSYPHGTPIIYPCFGSWPRWTPLHIDNYSDFTFLKHTHKLSRIKWGPLHPNLTHNNPSRWAQKIKKLETVTYPMILCAPLNHILICRHPSHNIQGPVFTHWLEGFYALITLNIGQLHPKACSSPRSMHK